METSSGVSRFEVLNTLSRCSGFFPRALLRKAKI
jgi:hypothetical protein